MSVLSPASLTVKGFAMPLTSVRVGFVEKHAAAPMKDQVTDRPPSDCVAVDVGELLR